MRKDIDLSFLQHPLTGDLATKTDSSAIKQSLRNIVLTSFYERGFNIEFGTNIRDSLFDNITPLHMRTMGDLIKTSIRNFEPQVEVVEVNVAETKGDVDITVVYTELNNPNEQTVIVSVNKLR